MTARSCSWLSRTAKCASRSAAYRQGALEGVLGCARHAVALFPADGADPNELPDPIVFL
jgi:hypothetical protein